MARILRSAETAKKHLSDHPYARIEEEYLTEHNGKPVNLDLELSRLDYEEMITPFIEETLWSDPDRTPGIVVSGRAFLGPPPNWASRKCSPRPWPS